MVGVVIYVAVDVVLQLLPPHYSPIGEAESNLAVGPFGWVMNLNFLGRAITSFALVGALLRVAQAGPAPVRFLLLPGLALFTFGGVCSAVLAFFPTDVPAVGDHSVIAVTTAGTVHLVVASAGFVAALIAIVLLTVWLFRSGCLPTARRGALAFTLVAAAGLVFLAATATVLPSFLGLGERLCLVGILGWTYWVARGIRRQR